MPEITESANIEYYKIIAPLIGAVLSIMGGFAAVFIRARLDKKQEIEYIKITLTDELKEICATIGRMIETYKKSNPRQISPEYFNELIRNTESYKDSKKRLFIFNKYSLRRQITTFYKELEEAINESKGKVGTLSSDSTNNANVGDGIATQFETFATKGNSLATALQSYKYRLMWFNKSSD